MFFAAPRTVLIKLLLSAIVMASMCVVLTPSADATITWSTSVYEPDQLSPAGVTASETQVATDAAGDAVAVWLQTNPSEDTSGSAAPDAGFNRVFEAYRPAGGNFGTATVISDDDGSAQSPKVAMNASGAAIVIWNEDVEDSGQTLAVGLDGMYAISSGGGAFTPAEPSVSDADGTNTNSLEMNDTSVGLDSAGDAVVAYLEGNTGPDPVGSVVANLRPAGTTSSFGTSEVLNSAAQGQNTLEPGNLSLAMDGAGDAVASWDSDDQSQEQTHVYTAYRPADALVYPVDATGASAGFGQQNEVSDPNDGDDPSTGPSTVALDASGDALVVWDQNNSGGAEPTEIDVEAAYRPATATYFSLPQEVNDYDTAAGDQPDLSWDGIGIPLVAFDGSGNAYIVAGGADSGVDSPNSFSSEHLSDPLYAFYRPAGGAFGVGTQVASSGAGAAQLGVDSQGRQAIIWQAPNGTDDTDEQGVSRDASSGAFTSPVTLTPAGFTLDGSVPQLSMSAAGQAVGVWQLNDGTEDLAEATFGTPPAAPGTATGMTTPAAPNAAAPTTTVASTTQPPPPAPPTPVASAINSAAPFQRGRAIVLTAAVASDVTQVKWSFQGFPDATGTVVNGQLQNSVRLHPTGTTFTATMTAVGPSGSTTATRTFQLLSQPTDQTTETVQRELTTVPKVVAVGDAATLLGNTTCGQLTLFVGQQQSSGCMRPINALSDIPNSELGSVQTMARSLGLDPSNSAEMTVAVQQVDGYVAPSQVLLNDKWPVTTAGNASLVSFPGIGALTSSNASLGIGGFKFGGLASGFSLNINPSLAGIPLGSLPQPSLPNIGGFPLVGDWNVDLGSAEAEISTDIQLPSWLGFAGVPTQFPITFKATPSGLELQSFKIGPLSAYLGGLNVSGLSLTYDQPTDTWTGSGKVCLISGLCLDMTPPAGEVKIVNGAFNYAGATLDFPLPGVPLFAGVDLTHIGFGIGLNPTRFQGNAAISVLNLVQLQGTIVVGFPTAGHPFYLSKDEVGSDFPSSLYGQAFDEPVFGASADVGVELPVIGTAKLGSGYFVYEVPDFIALGGTAGFTVPDVLEVGGTVAGEANFKDDTMNLYVEAHACLLLIGRICADGVADLSKGPNDAGGIGGCVGIDALFTTVHIGGGILWKDPTDPIIWPFDGCKWTRFAVHVNPVVANSSRSLPRAVATGSPGLQRAAISSRQTIVVKRGAPWPALKVFGEGAAPLVRVTGPDGQALNSTDAGLNVSHGGAIRILRYQGTDENFTVVGLENARPGVYTVTTLPGSVAFTTIGRTTNPPDAKIAAKLTGTGERRTLAYAIRNRPGQTVTFLEANSDGSGSTSIGHLRGGGRGSFHFTAPPGNRSRTIYAQFALNGLPAERIAVAHYTPIPATLAAPRGVKVTRTGTRVTVTFTPVSGATAYQVALTDKLTGFQLHASGRTGRIVLTKIPSKVGGTITVRAVDTTYQRVGLMSSGSVSRLTAPTNRFRALGHCKKVKRKLTCTGGPKAKVKAKTTTKTKTKTKTKK